MSSIDCPACGYEHDIGRFSDWYEALPRGSNRMTWECAECCCAFEVTVEWEPSFYSHEAPGTCRWWPGRGDLENLLRQAESLPPSAPPEVTRSPPGDG